MIRGARADSADTSLASATMPRQGRAFEDLISDADYLDDDAYAFYAHGEPSKAPRISSAIWRAVAEFAAVLALVIVVSLLVFVSRVRGRD